MGENALYIKSSVKNYLVSKLMSHEKKGNRR